MGGKCISITSKSADTPEQAFVVLLKENAPDHIDFSGNGIRMLHIFSFL